MSNKINSLKVSLLKFTIIAIIVHSGSLVYAQNYEWEIDKQKTKEQEDKLELDSLLVHLKKNWQLSLSYGQLYFDNSARSRENFILEFPKNMGAWNLSFARYLSEHLSVNVNLGILIKIVNPPRPDIFSILNGEEVDVEGGGVVLMPISVGVDYFFLKKRFRPYAGFSVGTVPVRSKYVLASGNLSNGIDRNEGKFSSNAPLVELSSGFIYRTGKKAQVGLNCEYLKSKDFNENIGSYKAYSGFKLSASYSIVF